MYRLRENGQIIYDQKEIQKNLTNYYRKLYTTEVKVDNQKVSDIVTPKLNEAESKSLDRPLTIPELGQAVKDLKNGKVGGVDGILIEFYKAFWGKLKYFMYELFCEIIADKKLHLSARRGIISLLEKIDKDPLALDSWRPISLLCADYKILAKVIARRLQEQMEKLIHNTQTGFMKCRNLGENTLRMMSLIEECENNQGSAVVISFDFRKAFDCLEFKAIDYAVAKFNVGQEFRSWIAILYTEIYSCVINNGFWGDWFQLERSTRQGCLASALIFALVIELLGCKIRTGKIRGILINGSIFLSVQYADNIWVALHPTAEILTVC